MLELGPMSQMALEDPLFSSLLWKMSPAALAKRVSGGTWKAWPYLQLLSRKLVDVAVGRCPRLIVACPPRHGKPICKKTLILLGDGSHKLLGEIQVGEYVVTHLGRPRKVSAIHEQGFLPSVEITTKTGRRVTGALDHPFLTPRGWSNARDLKIGSLLCVLRKYDPSSVSLVGNTYLYDEVISLRLTTADCRCLTVEEDETFTVSDIVVHNSEIVSKWFPLWFLETFHDKRVILCSYEADFAAKWGGKVRDIIAQNQDILTARFKTKNPSMHSWELEEGGGMACAGAGGPITGKGAELLIIDDPVKNSEDAESLTMRDKLWEWWLSTARTRIEPGGGAVVMMTRWHSNDLIGRLINPESYPEKGLRDEWEVFNFPAIAEPEADLHYAQFGVMVNSLRSSALVDGFGRSLEADNSDWRDAVGRKLGEPLCPDRYDLDALMKTRGSSSPKVWYSMYQQRPGDEMDQGNVYFTYDEKVNNRPLVYNPGWQLFVSLDFNIDPMTAVIGQYDQNSIRMMDACEVLEEVVLNNSNTYAMSDVLIKRLQPYKRGYTLMVEIYGDAAGAQKTANSKKTNWQIVAEHFKLDTSIHYKFVRKKDNPNIVDRVNAVNTMLMSADGTSRLFVDGSKCPELIKDFQKVKWQTDAGGNSTGMLEKRKDNKRTHISDALGYMVEYRFGMRAKAGGRKGFMQ